MDFLILTEGIFSHIKFKNKGRETIVGIKLDQNNSSLQGWKFIGRSTEESLIILQTRARREGELLIDQEEL